MKCIKCGCSMFDRMLHRTNPVGQSDAGWMCMPCIEKHEPELAKNLKGEADFGVVEDIENIIISDNKRSQS
jgi:Zn-finger protein